MRIYQRAFSLSELLITLCLIALLASTAAPALTHWLERNRNQATMQKLYTLLMHARTQAVLRKEALELCPSHDGQECVTEWSAPWLLKVRSSHQALFHSPPPSSSSVVRWSGFSGSIRFHSNGTSPISNGHFYVCDQHKVTMQIVLNRQGRIRWASDRENRAESFRCR